MLLLLMTASCVLFGSAARLRYKEECYGDTFRQLYQYAPLYYKGQMYFTPTGGSRKLILDNGESKDPRLIVYPANLEFRDLRDSGTFSISDDDHTQQDIIELTLLDCSEIITRYYGDEYNLDIPLETEYLEFTPLKRKDRQRIIWRLTDPRSFYGRPGVRNNGGLWQYSDLTQADNGHFNFRGKDDVLLYRRKLEVKEHVLNYDVNLGDTLLIPNLYGGPLWTVTFKHKGDSDGNSPILLIENRRVVNFRYTFAKRIYESDSELEVQEVESGGSGTFEFRDFNGYLAQVVTMNVIEEEPPLAAMIGIIAGIVFAVVICCWCCCVRKCCCRKSSSKRDESPLPVFHHDSTQPAAPSSSAAPAPHHSYQPVNSHVPKEPAASTFKPSVNNPVNIHVNPPQPEVSPLRGQRTDPAPSLGSDCLSSDPGPQFELKGLTFPSAPPLNSDPTFSYVYSSDKLNFL